MGCGLLAGETLLMVDEMQSGSELISLRPELTDLVARGDEVPLRLDRQLDFLLEDLESCLCSLQILFRRECPELKLLLVLGLLRVERLLELLDLCLLVDQLEVPLPRLRLR